MSNPSLALCIITYERDKLVEDFLINCSEYYIQAGIDIYYYDSSESNATEEIIHKWPNQEHIHLVKLPSDMNRSEKMFKIFQGYGLLHSYDFIWLSNDSMQCSKSALKQIIEKLDKAYDMVIVNNWDKEKVGTRTFTNADECLLMCGWRTSLLGAVILNSHSMLFAVDWEYYSGHFLSETLSDFSHVSFYFHRISELDHFCALHLSVLEKEVRFSKYKKKSCWYNRFFLVVCECWVEIMKQLPDCYTHKQQASVKLGNLSVVKNISTFRRFRKENLYNLKVFLKYWYVWGWVTSIPLISLFFVALIPRSVYLLHGNILYRRRLQRFKKFCRNHSHLLIYGTGDMGYIYAQYCEKINIDYEGFCVTRRKPGKDAFYRHPIYEFSEINHNAAYIIAMVSYNAEEVLAHIKEFIDEQDIFYDPSFDKDIRYMLGYGWLGEL